MSNPDDNGKGVPSSGENEQCYGADRDRGTLPRAATPMISRQQSLHTKSQKGVQ